MNYAIDVLSKELQSIDKEYQSLFEKSSNLCEEPLSTVFGKRFDLINAIEILKKESKKAIKSAGWNCRSTFMEVK